MDKELRMLEEELDKVYVSVVPNKQVAKEINRKGEKLLGSYRRDKEGKYFIHNIFLPENPADLFEKPVLEYMQLRTGLNREHVLFALRDYAKFHEFGHIKEGDEVENEKDTLRYLKAEKEKDSTGLFENLYIIASVANANDYIYGGEVAKEVAKEFKEIKEEAGVLKKYIQGYKMRMFD
jgi:hypothetical protein